MIDILLATYNGECYLAEQLDSIRSQTYGDWRLLISDDCSSDGTLEIVREYCTRDDRIRLVSEGHRYGSAKSNFLHLLPQSEAPYIMFSDQDDVWESDKVEQTLNAMKTLERTEGSSDKPLLVYGDTAVVSSGLKIVNDSYFAYSNIDPRRTDPCQLAVQNVVIGCTMMMNDVLRSLLLRFDPDDEAIHMHDWLAALVASSCGAMLYCDRPLLKYRQHQSNVEGAKSFHVVHGIRRRLQEGNCGDYIHVQMQVGLIERTVGDMMSPRTREAYRRFGEMSECSKSERLRVITAYGFWKSGILRSLLELLEA